MATLLLSCALTIVITTAQVDESNLCLWGRTVYDMPTNGMYRRGPEQANDAWYWKLDRTGQNCNGNYYFIFWYDTAPWHGWYIGFSTGSFGFGIQNTLIAKCINTGVVNDPIECGPNWSFGAYTNPQWQSSEIDADVYLQWGGCPQLNCSSLSIISNGLSSCDGTYTQTAVNEYTYTGGSDWVWWFNVPFFSWYCSTQANVGESCVAVTILNGADQGYQELSDGESWVYGNFDQDGSFICSGTAGTTYTHAPTTPNPTQPVIPTPFPTTVTAAPSLPTLNPTTPTGSPIVGSTNAPSKAPTYIWLGGDDDDANGDDDDDDDKGEDTIVDGISDTWFWILIVILAIILCCCIICCIYFMRKSKKRKNEDQFGHDDDDNNY